MVARLYVSTLVRKGHPVRLSLDRSTALAEFANFFDLWNDQLDVGTLAVQRRFGLLIVEYLGFLSVENAIAETHQFARLHQSCTQRVDAILEFVQQSRAPGCSPFGVVMVRGRRWH